MYNPFSSARWSDAWGALVSPSRAASFSSSGMRPAVEDPEAKPPRRRARGRSESRNCGLHSALPGANLPPRVVAGQVVAARRAAARWMRGAARMPIESGSAPGRGRGGRWRPSARGSAAAWQELSGPTRRRGWRLAVRSQRVVPRRIGRVPRHRCRLPPEAPSEAAVVGGGVHPRAARLRRGRS
jgi:hypothetical protein